MYVLDFLSILQNGWWVRSIRVSKVYHVTVMPCYDKKLEASRDDFLFSIEEGREDHKEDAAQRFTEVDCVLTSGEMLDLLQVCIMLKSQRR